MLAMIENTRRKNGNEREQRVIGDRGGEGEVIAVVDAGHPAPHGPPGQPDVGPRRRTHAATSADASASPGPSPSRSDHMLGLPLSLQA